MQSYGGQGRLLIEEVTYYSERDLQEERNVIEKQSHTDVKGERSAQNRYQVQRS